MDLTTTTIVLPDHEPITITYRPNTADRFTIEEQWKKHPYRLASKAQIGRAKFVDYWCERLVGEGKTPLIIDAGANIGASVLFFRWLNPKAHVIAIEPEPGNFELLRTNAGADAQVTLVQGALASSDGELDLYDPGRSTDAYRTFGGEGTSIGKTSALSVRTLLAGPGAGLAPFLAKIDIEGAEKELFGRNTDWVDLFPAIAIELHDWMLPGQAVSAPFLKCVGERGRDFVWPRDGEVAFSLRNEPKPPG